MPKSSSPIVNTTILFASPNKKGNEEQNETEEKNAHREGNIWSENRIESHTPLIEMEKMKWLSRTASHFEGL